MPVKGVSLGIAEAGIKKANRKDLLVMRLGDKARVAGVFTLNRFCAAPVTLCRQHLAGGKAIRALVVNTGNANAGTGEEGMKRAPPDLRRSGAAAGLRREQVLPFSTGVILEPLPVDKIIAGLPAAVANLKEANWFDAAHAIMTTDILPKALSKQISLGGKTVTVTGIAKGSGMIHPNMATMLGYVATDAAISQPLLEQLGEACRRSVLQLHHGGRRHLHQRLLHPDRHRRSRRGRKSAMPPAPTTPPCAMPSPKCRRYWRKPSCATARARPSS